MKQAHGKKGSLNISIEAIVIIVIAMTLLGLGLVFVRSQFRQITSTSVEVQEQVREQTMGLLKTSGEKVAFQRSLQLGKSEQKVVTLGVQNTGTATMYFNIDAQIDACNSDLPSGTAKPAPNECASKTSPAWVLLNTKQFDLRWEKGCQSLSPAQAEVYPINIRSPPVPGTFALKTDVTEFQDAACMQKTLQPVYASKLAFITIG